MRKMMLILITIWINAGLLSGCATSFHSNKKAKVFGTDMPSMKSIHDEKFDNANDEQLVRPQRAISDVANAEQEEFQWLPNPTLRMYVFRHLTAAGHPVPGYSTFFRLYFTLKIILQLRVNKQGGNRHGRQAINRQTTKA